MYFFKTLLFLFAIAWLVTRAVLVGHEFIGHAMFVCLFGANVTDVSLSWFSGGRVAYDNTVLQTWQHTVIALGGILFQFVAAVFASQIRRRVQHHWMRFALSLFMVICFIHGFAYASISIFFAVGDGHIVAYLLEREHQHLAFVLLLFVGVSSYCGAKELMRDSRFAFEVYGEKGKVVAVAQGTFVVLMLTLSAYLEPKLGGFDRPPIVLDSSVFQIESDISTVNNSSIVSLSGIELPKFFFLGLLPVVTIGAGALGIYRASKRSCEKKP